MPALHIHVDFFIKQVNVKIFLYFIIFLGLNQYNLFYWLKPTYVLHCIKVYIFNMFEFYQQIISCVHFVHQ